VPVFLLLLTIRSLSFNIVPACLFKEVAFSEHNISNINFVVGGGDSHVYVSTMYNKKEELKI